MKISAKKLLQLVTTLVLVGLVAVVVIMTGNYNKSHIVFDGPSMEPALHDGQRLKFTKYDDGATPARGDIVLYSSSSKMVEDHTSSSMLLHRVIALPAERLVIKDGTVRVFNTQHPEGFNPDTYLDQNVVTSGDIDMTLTPGTYFVMGDNRPNALDSRVTGPVDASNIVGKIIH